MPFIGNQPALSYTSFAKQDFTTSATTSYTLDNPVTNENEIALFINFVRQEPTTAYTASGTSLTLTSATSASDDMYCVYLGKAVQTVNPPNGSVGISQLSATGTKDSTTFLRGDNTFASAGGDNTPAFLVSNTANNTGKSDNTYSKLTYNVETYDTDSAFDLANSKFTVPSGKDGKYFFGISEIYAGDSASCNNFFVAIYKNGSITTSRHYGNGFAFADISPIFTAVLDLSAGDYIELYGRVNTDSGTWGQYAGGIWQGYKLIG